jgi:hypothetical protein
MSLKIVQISDGFGSQAVPSITDVQGAVVLNVVLTAQNISDGFILLPTASSNPSGSLLIWQGVGQQYNVDYEVNGVQLSFFSPLLSLLSTNDFITIYYV